MNEEEDTEMEKKRLVSKNELKEWLTVEARKYNQSSLVISVLKSMLGSETAILWLYQRRLRLTEYYHNTNKLALYLVSKVLLNRKANKYGIHIGLNVFGKGLKIMHLGPILTNGKVFVGENASIHINVSIVAHGINGGVPILGNNIVVGVGAVILGDISLADNIAVGANSVVNKSFLEPDIAIAGVPAKKISNNGRSSWQSGVKESNT